MNYPPLLFLKVNKPNLLLVYIYLYTAFNPIVNGVLHCLIFKIKCHKKTNKYHSEN